jgi:hypothetical protein
MVLLVHGGLGEHMDAERFWRRPGILAGLQAASDQCRRRLQRASP